jgi:hypothetical protein
MVPAGRWEHIGKHPDLFGQDACNEDFVGCLEEALGDPSDRFGRFALSKNDFGVSGSFQAIEVRG